MSKVITPSQKTFIQQGLKSATSTLNKQHYIFQEKEESVFNPLTDIPNLQLYLAKNNATVSSWLDQSPNAYNFVQATGTKQPIISANSVDFDGSNDFQMVSGANLLNYGSGYIFFSGYFSGVGQAFITSSDNSNENKYIIFGTNSDGTVYAHANQLGNNRKITSTNAVTSGNYFYCTIKWNNSGDPYVIRLNGNLETNVDFIPPDDGKGFSFITNRTGLSLGSLQRLSPVYSPAKVNKIAVSSSPSLTAAKITGIENFMSLPTNY